MGVIKRFAVSSIVLGTLAIAGGASALAFEGGADPLPAWPAGGPVLQSDVPADDPAEDRADVAAHVSSDVPSDVPSDEPADAAADEAAEEEELPETGGPDPAWGWFAPQGR